MLPAILRTDEVEFDGSLNIFHLMLSKYFVLLSFLFFGVLPHPALKKFRIDFPDLLICLPIPQIDEQDCLIASINPFSFFMSNFP